ncbi:MAG: hypothetical protein AMJ79_14575, partial [Phycisphaerae bacterium SM23_30]
MKCCSVEYGLSSAGIADQTPKGCKNSCGRASLGLLIGLMVAVLIAGVGHLTWPNYLELKLLNTRQRHFSRATFCPDIVHIDIDDASIEKMGEWPWPRRYLANLIAQCHQAGAKEVVLDIIMPDETKPELVQDGVTDIKAFEPEPMIVGRSPLIKIYNDAELAEAVRKTGIVTVPYHAEIYDETHRAEETPEDPNLDKRVTKILHAEPTPSFEEVFYRIWPEKSILDRDWQYQKLYRSYLYCLSYKYLSRFFNQLPPDKAHIPLAQMGRLVPPIPQIAQAVKNSGFATAYTDKKDGVVRRLPLLTLHQGQLHKQLSFTVACRALGIADEELNLSRPRKIAVDRLNLEIPLDEEGKMLIAWPGPWNENPHRINVVSIGQIWQNEQAIQKNQRHLEMIDTLRYQLGTLPEDISTLDEQTQQLVENIRYQLTLLGDPNELIKANKNLRQKNHTARELLRQTVAGKIVLVGSTTTGAFDFVVTPMSTRTPGVAVHGNILGTILQRQFLRRPPPYADPIIIVMLGGLMTLITVYFSPLKSALGGLLLMVVLVSGNFVVAFQYGRYWLGIVNPLYAILFSFTAVTFYRQITEGRARRRITARFKQYASPAVVDRIVESPGAVSLAGETRLISCYFSDLAGFTTISERLGPQKTVQVLNIYLDRMTEALDRYDATINKFQGDGIFAFFGAPVSQPDHARRACLAALDAQRELDHLVRQQQQTNQDFPVLTMRIGISTGE